MLDLDSRKLLSEVTATYEHLKENLACGNIPTERYQYTLGVLHGCRSLMMAIKQAIEEGDSVRTARDSMFEGF
jgi:hypothetical protein